MDKVTDGLKHDGGKLRLDLVPAEIIEAVGAVVTHGAEKYGEGNWRKVEPKRYRAALMRHICAWLRDPHGKDKDSGLPHLYHIACNVAFLLALDRGDVPKPNVGKTDVERCKDCKYFRVLIPPIGSVYAKCDLWDMKVDQDGDACEDAERRDD